MPSEPIGSRSWTERRRQAHRGHESFGLEESLSPHSVAPPGPLQDVFQKSGLRPYRAVGPQQPCTSHASACREGPGSSLDISLPGSTPLGAQAPSSRIRPRRARARCSSTRTLPSLRSISIPISLADRPSIREKVMTVLKSSGSESKASSNCCASSRPIAMRLGLRIWP